MVKIAISGKNLTEKVGYEGGEKYGFQTPFENKYI